MSEEDDDSRTHEATPRRLEEAYRKGDFPRSADLAAAAALGGLLVALAGSAKWLVPAAGGGLAAFLAQADRLAAEAEPGNLPVLTGRMLSLVPPISSLFLLPMACALLALGLQRAIRATPSNLAPRLSRVSPLAALRQKFGREGLASFAKGVVKLLAVSGLLGWELSSQAGHLLGLMQQGPLIATAAMGQMLLRFVMLALAVSLAFGMLDYGMQFLAHRRRNRMTRKELMDEMKDSEGDPQAKAQRRQRGQEIALNRMLADVATADVVIVNPTHYAVALKWRRESRQPPVCLAKGVDEMAARIRERAMLSAVPLHSDPPTARLLHATVDIGETIRPEHYVPVAAAIRFAEAIRKKRKRSWR